MTRISLNRVCQAGMRGLCGTGERPLIRPFASLRATFSPLRRGEGARGEVSCETGRGGSTTRTTTSFTLQASGSVITASGSVITTRISLNRAPSPHRSGEKVREAGMRGLCGKRERPLIRPFASLRATFSPLRQGEGPRGEGSREIGRVTSSATNGRSSTNCEVPA
jgi:hypothetical protein